MRVAVCDSCSRRTVCWLTQDGVRLLAPRRGALSNDDAAAHLDVHARVRRFWRQVIVVTITLAADPNTVDRCPDTLAPDPMRTF